MAALGRGVHPEDAAATLGIGRSTAYKWQAMHEAGESLEVKRPPGARTKLSQSQIDQLAKWIVGGDPRQLQIDFGLWTTRIVKDVIAAKFGVTYSRQAVGQLLRRMGLSPQRPARRAYEQDSAAVAAWRTRVFPALQKEAKKAGAVILFADEAGIRTDYHAGTTWGRVGVTPIVASTGNRVSVNMLSAVSATGELYFTCEPGRVASAQFIDFCEDLLADTGRNVFLVVDGHSIHTSKATRAYVESTNGRLRLITLPPYSPQLNPDEWVWNNIKPAIAKRLPLTKTELTDRAVQALTKLKNTPEKIRGFFGDPDLAYITT